MGLVTLREKAATPSTPDTGLWRAYFKSDGFYYLDDAGTETQIGSGGATTELDNLGTVAINTSLISDTTNTDDLGSATKYWRTLYSIGINTQHLHWNPALDAYTLDAAGDLDLTGFVGGQLRISANSGTEDELVSVSGSSTFAGLIRLYADTGDTITITHNGTDVFTNSEGPIVLSGSTTLLGYVSFSVLYVFSGSQFSDAIFNIVDNADLTKKIDFEASGITTATTRTITMPDADVDLGNVCDFICVVDEKTAGTNGGTFTSGAWRTRDLNTEYADTGGHASISSNQLTLSAGTYRCLIFVPAYAVGNHKAKLVNTTTGPTDLIIGTPMNDGASSGSLNTICGRFTVAASQALEVQHQCSTTNADDGFGRGDVADFSEVSVFTQIMLWKEA